MVKEGAEEEDEGEDSHQDRRTIDQGEDEVRWILYGDGCPGSGRRRGAEGPRWRATGPVRLVTLGRSNQDAVCPPRLVESGPARSVPVALSQQEILIATLQWLWLERI